MTGTKARRTMRGRDDDGTQVAVATGTPFMVVLTPGDGAWTASLLDAERTETPVAGAWPSVSRALLEGMKAAGSTDPRRVTA